MTDTAFTTVNTFLHHGIEGQKWGVQNGPPYPLDARRLKKTAKSRYREAKRNYYNSTIKKKELAAKTVAITAPIAKSAATYKLMPPGLKKISAIKSAVATTGASAVGYKVAKSVIRSHATPGEKMEYSMALQQMQERKEEYRAIKNFVRINSNKSLSPGEVEEVNKALQEYYNLVM